MRHWELIVPCGIADKGVTSLAVLLGRSILVSEVVPAVARHFGDVFGVEMCERQTEDLVPATANASKASEEIQ